MDRRTFVSAAAGAVLAGTFPANAQSPTKVPRIGVLYTGTQSTASQSSEAFRRGLREHGYKEGQNIVVEQRFGDAKPERLTELAAELVRLKVKRSSDGAIGPRPCFQRLGYTAAPSREQTNRRRSQYDPLQKFGTAGTSH